MEMSPETIGHPAPFTKIYMYEALQHFRQEQFPLLIESLLALSAPETVILLGSITHRKRLSRYYRTPDLRREYREIKRKGLPGLGTWWNQSAIRETCVTCDLRCEFLSQPAGIYTAFYHFDIRITRK
jgi:hypothetical protein